MPQPFVCHIDRRRAKFAPCEIAAHAPETPTALEEELNTILENCRRCHELPGDFTAWSEKTVAIIKEAIPLRRYVAQHAECVDTLCKEVGVARKRALSSSKLDLLCIYVCRPVLSEAERKKCSKVGKLLGKAHDDGVEPADAATWLKGVRLTDVAGRSTPAKGSTKFAVRFSCATFPMLAADIKEGAGWPVNAEAAAILEEAANRCEDLLQPTSLPRSCANTASAE